MYQEYPPCSTLAPFVDKFWITKGNTDYGMRFNILPDGCTDFIFALGEVTNPLNESLPLMQPYHTFFVGSMRSYSELIARTDSIHMMGVRFLACGLSPFISLSLNEFTDQRISCTDFPLLFDDCFTERLSEKANVRERIELIEQFLIQRLCRQRSVSEQILAAAHLINRSHGQLSISRLSDEICLCQRQLERKFGQATGFTPKEYSRIMKFQHAVTVLRQTSTVNDLHSVAIDCGYYDQAHFGKEVKRLSGSSPSAFLSLPLPEDAPLTYL